MTCKDCIYFIVCDDYDLVDYDGCADFKDKANWQEVKHGEWIKHKVPNMLGYVRTCSRCGYELKSTGEMYCSYCGARMDGGGK